MEIQIIYSTNDGVKTETFSGRQLVRIERNLVTWEDDNGIERLKYVDSICFKR